MVPGWRRPRPSEVWIAYALLVFGSGCRSLPGADPGSGGAGASELWRYGVRFLPESGRLDVQLTLPRGAWPELEIEPALRGAVEALSVTVPGLEAGDGVPPAGEEGLARGTGWTPVPAAPPSPGAGRDRAGVVASVDACQKRGCTLRYRFALRAAAQAARDPMYAEEAGGALIAPSSTWLLRPRRAPPGARYRVRVEVPPGWSFLTGLSPARESGVYEADAEGIGVAPFAAFGRLDATALAVEGGEILLARPAAMAWPHEASTAALVRSSAGAVAGYFGRFPVPRVLLLLLWDPACGTPDHDCYLTTLGNGGASIAGAVAPIPAIEAIDPVREWQMAHEMVHLAFPNLARRHHWLEEGVATYVEPVARARAGILTPEQVWGELHDNLAQGLPGPGDGGLDDTARWARTYWGGALFCLLADIRIREQSHGRRGLEDALRGILAAGGDIRVRWPIERVLEVGDRAAGVPVLGPLYQALAHRPEPTDLAALFRSLGVSRRDGAVVFDDAAPEAEIRKSITRR